jgi:hypothetical protein
LKPRQLCNKHRYKPDRSTTDRTDAHGSKKAIGG